MLNSPGGQMLANLTRQIVELSKTMNTECVVILKVNNSAHIQPLIQDKEEMIAILQELINELRNQKPLPGSIITLN